MPEKFDVIIIGGGNAGFGVSSVVHDAGKSVAFIESDEFGGTCPNRGCTPKKVLVAAAHTLDEIERAPIHAINVGSASLNWPALIDRKSDMIAAIPDGMLGLAQKRGTVYRGTAKFVGPNSVEVNGTVIDGDNIVIATGSKPRPLPIPGAEFMITSDDVLSERELPKDVIFVGGGVIAMEFAHVYARAGAKVTILEALPRLLPRADEDAVNALQAETERLGVDIKTNVKVHRIAEADGGLQIDFSHDGREHSQMAARIVNGTGRIANVDSLDLGAANVAHDGLKVDVDQYLRSTTNPSVWVAGDALVQSPQLSPVATYEGRIVGKNIVEGPSVAPDYSIIPNSVYTVPAMSSVGLTEAEAMQSDREITIKTSDMTGWFSSRTYGETAAFAKVLTDTETDHIVGAHLVGHQGEELIHLFAMAMKYKIPAADLSENIFAFPTFSSDVKSMI